MCCTEAEKLGTKREKKSQRLPQGVGEGRRTETGDSKGDLLLLCSKFALDMFTVNNYKLLFTYFSLNQTKEGKRLKEFLEDYDDDRDDPKYYK